MYPYRWNERRTDRSTCCAAATFRVIKGVRWLVLTVTTSRHVKGANFKNKFPTSYVGLATLLSGRPSFWIEISYFPTCIYFAIKQRCFTSIESWRRFDVRKPTIPLWQNNVVSVFTCFLSHSLFVGPVLILEFRILRFPSPHHHHKQPPPLSSWRASKELTRGR